VIFDSHVYCFVSPDEPAGHASAEAHLREVQVFHALHHQPAWRTRDRTPSDAGRLLDPTPEDPLRAAPGMAFRVDRVHHRLAWTIDGEEHTKQIYPPNLHDVSFGPGSCIGEMDYAGVDAALVHVDRALGLDVAYLADCVRRYPGRLYSMAPVDEAAIGRDTDRVIRELDDAIRNRGLHAIKFIPEYAYRGGSGPWDDGPFRPFWQAAVGLGVPIFFTLGAAPSHLDERDGFLAELAVLKRWMDRYPDVDASVTHGFPYRAFLEDDRVVVPDAIWEPWQNPRLHLEVSFPVRLGDRFDYPYREVWPVLESMLRHVGSARLLWGTDMPFQNRFCTYRQSRRWIETCGLLDGPELADVMGQTVARLLAVDTNAAEGWTAS
jgi:predicted TIM-barrel fold metal-dependent hydrolase